MGLIMPSQLSLVGVLLLCSTGLPLEGWAGPMGGVGQGLQRVDPSNDCWTLLKKKKIYIYIYIILSGWDCLVFIFNQNE